MKSKCSISTVHLQMFKETKATKKCFFNVIFFLCYITKLHVGSQLPYNFINVFTLVAIFIASYTFFSSEDINECAIHNGLCEHNCHNTIGSYYCSCNLGYGLSANGHSCVGMFAHVFWCINININM